MSASLDSKRIAQIVPSYEYALLVTVSDDYQPHTTAITPSYHEGTFNIGPIGKHRQENLSKHPAVTLVFPAPTVEMYSLLIDGIAHLPDDPTQPVIIHVINALLHRPMPKNRPQAQDNPFECISLTTH